jgi:hypothetical protein
MKDPTDEITFFDAVCPDAVHVPNTPDEDEETDEQLLERLGFDRALARLQGIDIPDEEEDDSDTFLPSQRGFSAIGEEYSRMGCTWED